MALQKRIKAAKDKYQDEFTHENARACEAWYKIKDGPKGEFKMQSFSARAPLVQDLKIKKLSQDFLSLCCAFIDKIQ